MFARTIHHRGTGLPLTVAVGTTIAISLAAALGAPGMPAWANPASAHLKAPNCRPESGTTFCSSTVTLKLGDKSYTFAPASCTLGGAGIDLSQGNNLSMSAKWITISIKATVRSTKSSKTLITWNLGPHNNDWVNSPKATFTAAHTSGTISGADDLHHEVAKVTFNCK